MNKILEGDTICTIYKLKCGEKEVVSCKYAPEIEVLMNAVRQYTFKATEKEFEQLHGPEWVRAVNNILGD